MRFETVVPHLFRVATRDEVIPLSEEVLCRSGNVIKQLSVPRGTNIIISDVAYHRWPCLILDCIVKFTRVLQEQRHMGGGCRNLETKQVVGRDNQVHRNECRRMVQFVHQRYFRPCLSPCLTLVLVCLLALDNVPVSGGALRECRNSWSGPRCAYPLILPGFLQGHRIAGIFIRTRFKVEI
jgi:hypothetical protein